MYFTCAYFTCCIDFELLLLAYVSQIKWPITFDHVRTSWHLDYPVADHLLIRIQIHCTLDRFWVVQDLSSFYQGKLLCASSTHRLRYAISADSYVNTACRYLHF